MTFNPADHVIQLKNKDYLETKWRLVWFREQHPKGAITTEVVSLDPVLIKATVCDEDGTILGTAHAGAVDKGNAVWSGRAVEKAETAAVGRALAHAGFGTQFVDDDEAESGHLADSPVEPRKQPAANVTPILPGGDLRDIPVARAFMEDWYAKALSDAEILAALGVKKLREWTHGRTAADTTVSAWLETKLSKEAG